MILAFNEPDGRIIYINTEYVVWAQSGSKDPNTTHLYLTTGMEMIIAHPVQQVLSGAAVTEQVETDDPIERFRRIVAVANPVVLDRRLDDLEEEFLGGEE